MATSIILPTSLTSLKAAETEPARPANHNESGFILADRVSGNSDTAEYSSVTTSSASGNEKSEGFLIAEGRASFYANRFHGRRTASGEHFDRKNYTAAHRSLPFGTKVQVTNLDNGRQIVVTVNDRGPHRKGRIIDISQAAAREIGIIGVGNVRIEAYD